MYIGMQMRSWIATTKRRQGVQVRSLVNQAMGKCVWSLSTKQPWTQKLFKERSNFWVGKTSKVYANSKVEQQKGSRI